MQYLQSFSFLSFASELDEEKIKILKIKIEKTNSINFLKFRPG